MGNCVLNWGEDGGLCSTLPHKNYTHYHASLWQPNSFGSTTNPRTVVVVYMERHSGHYRLYGTRFACKASGSVIRHSANRHLFWAGSYGLAYIWHLHEETTTLIWQFFCCFRRTDFRQADIRRNVRPPFCVVCSWRTFDLRYHTRQSHSRAPNTWPML